MMMMMMTTMVMRPMFRQFSSIATSRAPISMTVRNVISKHIEGLSKKHSHLIKLRQTIWERQTEVLNMMQLEELVRSEPRVEHQLGLLQKLAKEIIPFTATPSQFPLSIIYNYLDDLLQKLDAISQVEESISLGVHIDTERQELLNSKSIVMYRINLLQQVLHDIAWESALALDNGDDKLQNPSRLPESIIPNLSFESPLVKSGMEIVETVESEPVLHKHRYLLISNGCQIHCLDLKKSKNLPLSPPNDAMRLPIIATLNLSQENLPAVVGLFKWRSNAYMIGGQKLPTAVEEPDKHRPLFKPTSSRIYGLSLNDSSMISHTNMGNLLKKPKIWPIVEEINGETHVIDCLPGDVCRKRWTGSHEVLDSESLRWIAEVPMPEVKEDIVITCYLAVGNKIYAKSAKRSFLVFDSDKMEWDMVLDPLKSWPGQGVCDILDNEHMYRGARCVGGFPYGDPRDPLYVVIAPKKPPYIVEHNYGVYMVAFLVNSSGEILCSQHLTDFFGRPGSLRDIRGSTIIEVEEEDNLGKKKKTLCSIITGSPWDDICGHNYVSINIFSLQELPEAADKVRTLVKESDGQARQPPVELEFARVHVTERHLFKKQNGSVGSRGMGIKLQACFL